MEGGTVVFLGRVRNSGGFGLVLTIATGASSSETEPRDSSSVRHVVECVTKLIEAGASTRRIAFLAVFFCNFWFKIGYGNIGTFECMEQANALLSEIPPI